MDNLTKWIVIGLIVLVLFTLAFIGLSVIFSLGQSGAENILGHNLTNNSLK